MGDTCGIRLRSFHYGAEFSLREKSSHWHIYRYLQALDRELYAKTIEHRVLDALVHFLEDHNIDSSPVSVVSFVPSPGGMNAGRAKEQVIPPRRAVRPRRWGQ
ncbi:hypothetical protein [Streptomyces europaeiscabiei]|uniref:hypothetical protein n=1 Tax=Streptomyces europaeiscabiei TaxID=146819 RepID=UPI002E2CD070|nr:hypothetical protein [Streptomyces europaeiscabiei]